MFWIFQSHSSVLTDDEAKGAHSFNGVEKTIRTVYAQKKVYVFSRSN